MSNVLKMLSRGGAAAAETDPNFKQTVLLLHGDGTNGAQNNTFLDSSTNNFTITRNGNTTQGTFSPFSLAEGEWSNYFDGSGDFLDVPDNAALEIGASSFCIEAWINPNALPASGSERYIAAKWISASRSFAFGYVNTSGTIQLRLVYSTTGNTSLNISQNAAIVANTWQHIAITRDGTTARFFLNGVQQGSTQTLNATFWDSTEVLTIGRFGTGGGSQFDGYLSNLRVVIGSAVYTSNFTPSNTPLTAITNTRLLTCQSNRFVDNSTNAFAITANGDVRVTPFSPFAPTAAYSAGTNGGSGYFDGTGDYLTTSTVTALQMDADFTWEAWVYPISNPSSGNYKTFWAQRPSDTGVSSFGGPAVVIDSSGNFLLFISNAAAGSWSVSGFDTGLDVSLNQWQHIALVKNGTTVTLYKNGVAGSSTTHSTAVGTSGNTSIMAGAANGAQAVDGYMSSFRIVKGTAVYTGAFTPPIAPISTSGAASASAYPSTTNVNTSFSSSGTPLLLNFTNAGIIDNTGKNNLETVGNAQIDTTTKKFGTGSLEFDGSGDWLLLPASPDMAMGTGDFTFECWIYATAASDSPIYECRSTNSNTNGFTVTAFSSTVIRVYTTAVLVTATVANYLNTWVHVAFTRSGSTNRLFINGNLENTATASDNFSNQVAVVGGGRYGGGVGSTTITNSFTGYIDDLRITKGVARYTANFTAPTKEFPDL